MEGVAKVAEILDCSESYVRQLTGGHRNIGTKKAREIERRFGRPENWLDTMSEPTKPTTAKVVSISGDDFAFVPMVESFYHGGNGDGLEHPGDPTFLKSLSFRTDWLEYMGLDANQLKVAMVHGKSMEPTLGEADVILVDKRESDISKIENGAIYALVFNKKPLVKRVYIQETGNVKLVSDNKRGFDDINYSEEEAKEIEFIGRVVWRGGEVS